MTRLKLFRSFLTLNRREVVVLFVEPYVPVDELERALKRTDLLDEAAAIARDKPLPTLRRLIGAGTRLVILTEKDGGARPWYLLAVDFYERTGVVEIAQRLNAQTR